MVKVVETAGLFLHDQQKLLKCRTDKEAALPYKKKKKLSLIAIITPCSLISILKKKNQRIYQQLCTHVRTHTSSSRIDTKILYKSRYRMENWGKRFCCPARL
jgi:hypothetical protein